MFKQADVVEDHDPVMKWADKVQTLREGGPSGLTNLNLTNELWKEHEAILAELKWESFQVTCARNLAVKKLLNLSPAPVSLINLARGPDQGKEFSSQSERRPNGLKVLQQVFLVGPTESQSPESELDDFAASIAAPYGVDGVYCLAGVRGCGKSSVLNRVEWYCKNWVKPAQPPLLVRFDLGCAFVEKRFLLDLISKICLQVRLQCVANPKSPSPAKGNLLRTIAAIGQWCRLNMAWAAVLCIIYLLTFLTIRHELQIPPKTDPQPTTQSLPPAQTQPTSQWQQTLFSPTAMHIVIGAGAMILAIGFCQRERYKQVQSDSNKKQTKLLSPLISLWETVGAAYVAALVFRAILPAGYHGWPPHVDLSLWILLIVIMGSGQFLLPNWCWLLMECDNLAAGLRARADSNGIQLPGLSYLGSLAKLLLPNPDTSMDLKELDTPFQHQLVKDLLRRCTREFGRIVILIDDVDVLPSQYFHELFRMLRPASKVANVCVVVCVPRFFFDAFRSNTLGDVHSTVRQVYLLGNSELNDDKKPPEFPLRKLNSKQLTDFLRNVLASRAFFPLELNAEGNPAQTCEVIEYALKRWADDQPEMSPAILKSVLDYLGQVGPSIREILREMERLLGKPLATPFDFFADKEKLINRINEQLERGKKDYFYDETSLCTDVMARWNDRIYQIKLDQ